jgi:HSP90 family molecular chaperone
MVDLKKLQQEINESVAQTLGKVAVEAEKEFEKFYARVRQNTPKGMNLDSLSLESLKPVMLIYYRTGYCDGFEAALVRVIDHMKGKRAR